MHKNEQRQSINNSFNISGLTQNNSTSAVDQNTKQIDVPKTINRNSNDHTSSVKRPRPSPTPLPKTNHPVAQQEEEIEEIVPVVKSEPHDPSPIMMTAPIQPVVEQEQSMAMYNDRSQMGGSMMTSMDTEQYDESYEGDYAGQYGEESYDGHQGVGGQDVGAGKGYTFWIFHFNGLPHFWSLICMYKALLCGSVFACCREMFLKQLYRG